MTEPVLEPDREMPTLEELTDVVALVREHGRDLYLRYSRGPQRDSENGCSRDYEAGVDLPGLSVTDVAPEDWWPRPVEDWVARRICKYAELGEEGGRYAWLLTGRLTGHGPDHEPVVQEVRPVARIGAPVLDQARKLYAERFDVGEDSRSES
ncbi:MAG TPA: DUF6098 family protein [Marmoricola sp.]|jgi:hypothetical protein